MNKMEKLLAEVDQMTKALRVEQMEETPNKNTILAIQGRLRSLDSILDGLIRKGMTA
jgi:ppGpp synthetase/RelA/SpoT-type nucleotidyltranferase